jgi:hypothetical protein
MSRSRKLLGYAETDMFVSEKKFDNSTLTVEIIYQTAKQPIYKE